MPIGDQLTLEKHDQLKLNFSRTRILLIKCTARCASIEDRLLLYGSLKHSGVAAWLALGVAFGLGAIPFVSASTLGRHGAQLRQ